MFATAATPDTEPVDFDPTRGIDDLLTWLFLSAGVGLAVLVAFTAAVLWLSDRDQVEEPGE